MLCRQVTNNETKWEVHSFFFFPDDQKIEKSWAWQTYIWMYCNFEIYSEKYWLLILSRLTNNGTKSTCFVFFPDEPKKKRWIGMYCTWDVIHCLADAEIGMLRIQKIETPAKIIYLKYYKKLLLFFGRFDPSEYRHSSIYAVGTQKQNKTAEAKTA